MVKKKGKSKRTTLKDKYKIQKRVLETHRKQRKQAKRDSKNGVISKNNKKQKDPGIPNSWPFKKDLLKEIQYQRERQDMLKQQAKEDRQQNSRNLHEHQKQGGTAKTVQELLEQATASQQNFIRENKVIDGDDVNSNNDNENTVKLSSDIAVNAGQQSRRAYLRDLRKVIDSADVLLQVLDARDPLGSRVSKGIENFILSHHDKRMVLVLNKIDLVPHHVVVEWLTYLRKFHPTLAIHASAGMDNNKKNKRDSGTVHGNNDDDNDNTSVVSMSSGTTNKSSSGSNVVTGMEGLLQLLKNYARNGNTKKCKSAIVVGCIGLPNVGKSSIINALKRTRVVGVSPKPGFTTSLQEVVLDQTVRLIDSPGVVFDNNNHNNSNNSNSIMLNNCIDTESITDPVGAIQALLERCDQDSLIMRYNLPAFEPGNVDVFLGLMARTLGKLNKGGVPNKEATARVILKDWNRGKIRYYTVPPTTDITNKNIDTALGGKDNSRMSNGEMENEVKVVSHFSPEFDLQKYDNQVLQRLKKKDVLDFVQMNCASESGKTASTEMELVEYLLTNNQDDEDSGDAKGMDEDSDDERNSSNKRMNIADAEDYDFNEL